MEVLQKVAMAAVEEVVTKVVVVCDNTRAVNGIKNASRGNRRLE